MADLVTLELHGFTGVYDMLMALPAEVVSKKGGPVKLALKKAAQLLRKEVIQNLRRVTSNQTKSGQKESTGFLAKNVIASRGRMPAGIKGEKYLVRVKRRQVTTTPEGKERKSKSVTTTIANAQRLEYGSHHQPAEPFIRPAFKAKAEAAIRLVETDLPKRIVAIANKLGQAGKGKP